MPGALDGVRVIDFGQYIAGPMTAMFLADQGADVIRVDPPGGPAWDSPANVTYNRNKRSITLDLASEADRATARQLIATADVVVENFRPGVMERFGLGSATMTKANPRLIYCSLPGFGKDDPRSGIKAWEGVVGAASALYRPHPKTGRPVFTTLPIPSVYAAFQASVAVAMALNARERDGLGQVVEVPLFNGMFGAVGYHGQKLLNNPDAGIRPTPAQLGVNGQYQCKDGRWVMYMGGNLNAQDFLDATGAADWVKRMQAGEMTFEELNERAIEMFKTKTALEWEQYAEQIGTECGVCRTSAEWLVDPGATESGIVVDIEDDQLGTVRGPGLNVRLSDTPPSIRWGRRAAGVDGAEVRAELANRSVANGSKAVEPALKSALQGVKVIDLCIVLAGPTAGRTLAEFGADVVKIDSPTRAAVAFHNDINRAKRSIILDLKSEEGMSVFWRLVQDADVVVQNFRKGVAERLGLGYDDVRARRPDIVYASLNTYGRVGPFAGRPGHEQIAQAAAGMQERFGGDGKPTLQPFAVNDYGTGFMGGYAIALALLHRQRTGQGQHVNTGLALTATMLQSSLIQSYAGKEWNETRGQDAVGSSPLHRAYEATNGWVFLAAQPGELARCPELASIANLSGDSLAAALEWRIKSDSVATWVHRLTAAGIGAHRVVPAVEELMDDPWVQSQGLSITRTQPDLGPIRTIGPSPRLSRTPVVPGRPASTPGADAAEILAEIGLANEMERLVRDRVVVTEGIAAR